MAGSIASADRFGSSTQVQERGFRSYLLTYSSLMRGAARYWSRRKILRSGCRCGFRRSRGGDLGPVSGRSRLATMRRCRQEPKTPGRDLRITTDRQGSNNWTKVWAIPSYCRYLCPIASQRLFCLNLECAKRPSIAMKGSPSGRRSWPDS